MALVALLLLVIHLGHPRSFYLCDLWSLKVTEMEARTMSYYWMVKPRPRVEGGKEFLLPTSFPLSLHSQPQPPPQPRSPSESGASV